MSRKTPNNKDSDSSDLKHLDIETVNAASATDLTGMIPANADPDNVNTYKDIRGFGNEAATQIITDPYTESE